jgi:hypothetical protein
MTNFVAGLAFIALTAAGSNSLPLQAPPGSGHWEGSINVQGKELRLTIDLAAKGGAWEGAAGLPDMNSTGMDLAGIVVQGDAVTFSIKGAPGDPTFKGKLSADAKNLSGDFSQGPAAGTFTLAWKGEPKIEAPPRNAPLTKDLEGDWDGSLDLNGNVLRLSLKLTNQAGGGATGVLISLDQGGAQIPLRAIEQKDAHVKFTVPGVGGTYEGDVKDGQIVGTWSQGPGSLPLTFKRAAAK